MYLEVHAELGYPCLFEFRILYQSDRLQVPTMEVKAQSMREQLRVELGKFGKLRAWKCLEIYPKLGKVVVIR